MQLSILILNYNGLAHLPECLESVHAQLTQEMEVILVDNASHDGSVAWVQINYPAVRIIVSPENLGFASGNNLGLKHCLGEWVFILNNDTALEPNCLEQILAATAHNIADALQCLMLDYQDPSRVDDAGDTFFTTGLPYTWRGTPTASPSLQTTRPIFCACAGAAIWKRDLLTLLGGFDEQFFLNYEDCDLSLRARHLGYRIALVPQARIRHKGSATLGRYTRTSVYYSVRNLGWMKLKNYPYPVLLMHLPATFFVSLLSAAKYISKGAGSWWLQARIDQIRGLPRILAQRKSIMGSSTLDWREFDGWLKRGWWRHFLGRT